VALYLYKLTPPRPTFPAQMTPEEGAAMQRHFGYGNDQMERRAALVFGPVADPQGAYGIAILDVASEAEAKRICAQDPVITAKLCFTSGVFHMPNAVAAAR
jgi:hypothetical protein